MRVYRVSCLQFLKENEDERSLGKLVQLYQFLNYEVDTVIITRKA